jgi:hypothetical protein
MFLGIQTVVWELIGLLVSFTALGVLIGRFSLVFNATEERYLSYIERASMYDQAIEDLDKWCGATSAHAYLIANHLKAVGQGESLNSGTPNKDEPCTISGLREQLRRLDEQVRDSPL